MKKKLCQFLMTFTCAEPCIRDAPRAAAADAPVVHFKRSLATYAFR
jgi:hypothetical protein